MKLPDSEAYKLLVKYGIPTAKWSLARSLKEAEIAAANMTFPLILKADSQQIIHKLKSGCIKYAFNRGHLRKSFETVLRNAKKQAKNINGVLLQELIYSETENVQELIVGAKHDDQFGPVIMFGAGGRLTEEKDVCFRLIPITKYDAREMVREPKVSRLISRYNKIADVLVKVSKLAEYEKISELDINPLLISDKGVLATDVRIIL